MRILKNSNCNNNCLLWRGGNLLIISHSFFVKFNIQVQLSLIYFGGSIFRTTGLTFFELNVTILLAFTVIPFDFIRKTLLRKLGKPNNV